MVVPPLAAQTGEPAAALDLDDSPGIVLVGGSDAASALDLVRRAKAALAAKAADVPVVFVGRGAARRELEAAGASEVLAPPAFLRDVVTIARVLRGVPGDQRTHLTGSLAETTGVLTLVRAFSALGRSAVLTLIRGLRRGEVRFYHGEVTSAQVGLIHGQAALHQLLLWTDARFDYAHEDIVRRQQIPLSSEELFADAEQFLEGVREHAGALSPATILEQDNQKVHALGKQIPTEVHGVLRMFDGHRVLADILEDSPYRVFETLRVAQKAIEVGLLRAVSTQRPKATWRAVLAIEEWLVGNETRDAVVERTQALDSGPVRAATPAPSRKTKRRGGKRRSKKLKAAAVPSDMKGGPIDWGALVPRVIGAEVGPLSGVVPAHAAHGEVELPTRDKPREGLEALMDTQKRQRIFPTDVGLEPSIVVDAGVGADAAPALAPTPAHAVVATDTIATAPIVAPGVAAPGAAAATATRPKRKRADVERGDDRVLVAVEANAAIDAAPDAGTEPRTTARHAAPPPPAAEPSPGATGSQRAGSDTARHAAPLRPPAIAAPKLAAPTPAAPEPPAVPEPTNGAPPPTRAPVAAPDRAAAVDPAMASLVAVPTHVEPMKSDPVAAVTAVSADAGEPRTVRPGATDAKQLVRALVAEVVPPAAPPAADVPPPAAAAPVAPQSVMTTVFERPSVDPTPPFEKPQPADAASHEASAAPQATDDEPSDGVVRAIVASADTAPASPARMRPPEPEYDGPPIKETTGEIRGRTPRDTNEPPVVEPSILIAEPSILVGDLAAAHDAVSAAVAKPAPAAPPPADAASPSRELAVSDVRRDAVAFSEAEEAFFRGAEKTASVPKVETFDDLDEGYQPPGFWDRVFGRKKPK